MTTTSSVSSLVQSIGEIPAESIVFGHSDAMQALRARMDKVASANVPVLIQGESGTGKDIIARMIHGRSPWKTGPYVKVNCPAIPGTLLESELFGYEKGAFTGAYGMKPGRVELAHRGTLFLDEIAELDPAIQAKLLQLLQDGQFCRIGAQGERQVEVRVVCATNRQLQQAIKSGTFRQDLFYRINVVTIELPPLQERSGDIPMLLNYFLEKYSKQYNSPVRTLSDGLWEVLREYRWPGNIRELENLAKRYVILGPEEAIGHILKDADQDDPALEGSEIPPKGGIQLKKLTRQAVKQLERKIILIMLEVNARNRKASAHALRISSPTLLYKMKEAGLSPKMAGKRPKGKRTVVANGALAGDAQMAQGRPGRVPLIGK